MKVEPMVVCSTVYVSGECSFVWFRVGIVISSLYGIFHSNLSMTEWISLIVALMCSTAEAHDTDFTQNFRYRMQKLNSVGCVLDYF